MISEEALPNDRKLMLLSRLLFTSLFFISGITHFTHIPYYLGLMHEAIPYREFLILVSGVVELAGAAMILFNWRPRLGAWMLVLFLVPVTVVVHGYGMLYMEGEIMRLNQQAHFLKGISLIGACLLITQLGVSHKARETSS